MTIQEIPERTTKAHELYGDFWFNSEPVPISALRGQVVLVHFWDYTCIHCVHTLPYIKEWHRRYNADGLVVVGVHTPKHPFAKNPEEVQKAIERLGIRHPVVLDNQSVIAATYQNRFWPAIYLIDKHGYIRFCSVGEGNYRTIEQRIHVLLRDAGHRGDLPLPMEAIREEDKVGAVCYRATPELFTGYLKGSIGNVEGYSPESVVDYHDPGYYVEGKFYAVGPWMNDRNCLRLSDDRTEGHIIVRYLALEANAVIMSEGDAGFPVLVMQDDRFLTEENKGDDIALEEDGRSIIVVTEARMYNLIKNKEFGEHTLRLSTTSRGFALFSLTFVSCVIPETVSNN
jgi:thiol-disulfide isomerase/thioredoxin